MSDKIVEKTLTVIAVSNSVEFSTGDNMYQVGFGHFETVTQEMLDRLPPVLRQFGVGSQAGVNEIVIFLKTNEVPYRVGSQWKVLINKDGSVSIQAK